MGKRKDAGVDAGNSSCKGTEPLVGGAGDDWQVCWWEVQEMTGRLAGGGGRR